MFTTNSAGFFTSIRKKKSNKLNRNSKIINNKSNRINKIRNSKIINNINNSNILSKSNLLCRENSIKYFKWISDRSDFLSLYAGNEIFQKPKNSNKNEIHVHLDHQTSSICSINKIEHTTNFLISENIQKNNGFQWPIGLESSMILNQPSDTEKFINLATIASKRPNGNGVINTLTSGPYKKPASGQRDDRTDMNNVLEKTYPVKKQSFQNYLQSLVNSQYSLCPEGNGIDTHRFYESYAMGSRPIIRRGILSDLHSNFDAKIVENWSDVPQFNKSATFVPDLEKLTVGYWAYKSLRSRCKIVQFFTKGHIEQWRNFLETARRVGVDDLIVVYALDEETVNACTKEGVEVRRNLLGKINIKNVSYHKNNWGKVVSLKIEAIEDALCRGDFILYLDTDIVLLKDPFKNIFNLTQKDILVQTDSGSGEIDDNTMNNLCSGCIFLYPTRKSINFVKQWKKTMKKYKCDQPAFNSVYKMHIAEISILPRKDFPNGALYWDNQKIRYPYLKPVLIHNNHIVGIDAKNNRFKKSGLWFLNSNT